MPKKVTEETTIGELIHEWEIPEYGNYDRGATWIILASILGLGLIVYAVYVNNFLFALFLMLMGIILYLQHNQEPIQVPFGITDLGILVGNKFYPYKEIDSFFIVYEPPEVKKLYLNTDNTFKPHIKIPLKEQDPVEIRHTLREHISEDLQQEEEPISDMIARKWKLH